LLRAIPGDYDIDRWPIACAIRSDESIESWLARAAARYGITPRELLAEAGVADRSERPGRLARLVRQHAVQLACTLGCPQADVHAAAAEMLPNTAVVEYLSRYHAVTRPTTAGSTFCSECLSEPDPHWKREWSSAFAITCSIHGCLLVRSCPRCGDQPWSTSSWLSQEPDKPRYRCHNRLRRPSGRMMRRRRCNFDLRTVEPFEMDADAIGAHQLALQLWQQYVHDPKSRLQVTDIEVTATIAFDALCQLVDESVRIFTVFEDDYDRTALVRALSSACRVLSSASAAAAAKIADTVGLLNPAGPITPIGPDNVLLRRKRNPLLAAIRLNSVRATLSPATQLTFDCGNRHPRYPIRENEDLTWQRLPEHHPERPELNAARIPQVLWPGTVWAGGGDTTLIAAAQAMALTKIGDTRPLSIIALDLGLPKGIATPVTQYWRQIVRDGQWPEALAALTDLKEQLRYNQPPIDYQQRRIIADDPRRLVLALTRAGASSRAMSRAEFGDVVRRYWEHFTGGDIRYAASPCAIQADETADWPRRLTSIDDEHGAIFTNAYESMATSNSLQPSGPLTWQPP
jgi:hypothetical protein